MNDRSFTKLFSGIVTSSIWDEDSDTRIVWVTMLALSNQHGEVLSTITALSRSANVRLESTELAVEKFHLPDLHSRTPDNEGRRIETIQGGWRLLNYDKYRAMMSEVERREYKRVKESERRERLRVDKRGQNGHKQTKTKTEKQKQKESKSKSPISSGLPSREEYESFCLEHDLTKAKDYDLFPWHKVESNWQGMVFKLNEKMEIRP